MFEFLIYCTEAERGGGATDGVFSSYLDAGAASDEPEPRKVTGRAELRRLADFESLSGSCVVLALSVPPSASLQRVLACGGLSCAAGAVEGALRFVDGRSGQHSLALRFCRADLAKKFAERACGTRFSPDEACHVIRLARLEVFPSAERPDTPCGERGGGSMTLPTCPRCLERLDSSVTGVVLATGASWPTVRCRVCSLLAEVSRRPGSPRRSTSGTSSLSGGSAAAAGAGATARCEVCGTDGQDGEPLWVCMTCGFVGCGRYESSHMVSHFGDTRHRFTVDLGMQRIWDYVADGYVHRLRAQHESESGPAGALPPFAAPSPLPLSAAAAPPARTASANGDAGSLASASGAALGRPAGLKRIRTDSDRGDSGNGTDDDGLGSDVDDDEAASLVNAKLQSVVTLYNALLADQLQEQLEYFQGRMGEFERETEALVGSQRSATSQRALAAAALKEQLADLGRQSRLLDKEHGALEARIQKLAAEENFLLSLREGLDPADDACAAVQADHTARIERMRSDKDKTLEALQKRLDQLMADVSRSARKER